MEKQEKQLTYETPEVEAIEFAMEENTLASNCNPETEDQCITNTSCMEDFI